MNYEADGRLQSDLTSDDEDCEEDSHFRLMPFQSDNLENVRASVLTPFHQSKTLVYAVFSVCRSPSSYRSLGELAY